MINETMRFQIVENRDPRWWENQAIAEAVLVELTPEGRIATLLPPIRDQQITSSGVDPARRKITALHDIFKRRRNLVGDGAAAEVLVLTGLPQADMTPEEIADDDGIDRWIARLAEVASTLNGRSLLPMAEANLRKGVRSAETADLLVEAIDSNYGYASATSNMELMAHWQDVLDPAMLQRMLDIRNALRADGTWSGQMYGALSMNATHGSEDEIFLVVKPHCVSSSRNAFRMTYGVGPKNGPALKIEDDLSATAADLADQITKKASDLHEFLEISPMAMEDFGYLLPALHGSTTASGDFADLIAKQYDNPRAHVVAGVLRRVPAVYSVSPDRSISCWMHPDASFAMDVLQVLNRPAVSTDALSRLVEEDITARKNNWYSPLPTWRVLERVATQNGCVLDLESRGGRFLVRVYEPVDGIEGVLDTYIAASFGIDGKAIVTFNGVRGDGFHYSSDPETIESAFRSALARKIEIDLARLGYSVDPYLGSVDEDEGPTITSVHDGEIVEDEYIPPAVAALAQRWASLREQPFPSSNPEMQP